MSSIQLAADPSVASTPQSDLSIPELWVLAVVRTGYIPNVLETFQAMGVDPERTVLVSDHTMRAYSARSQHVQVHGADRDAVLWNAGLNYIKSQNPSGEIWDVLLFDPTLPVPMASVNNLRHHMRMLDVWMAEPDTFDTLSRSYETRFDVDRSDVYSQAVTIMGEQGVRFDWRIHNSQDAWADFCRRTRCTGGSVVVSSPGLRETLAW